MPPDELALLLVTVGALLLLSPAAEVAGRRLGLPRVTLLLGLGLLLGPIGLDVVPEARERWYPALAEVALAMVGFVLGGEFTVDNLRQRGRAVLRLSAAVTLVSFAVVAGVLWLAGVPPALALVLGTAATATDPAAVEAVVRDGRAEGPTTSTLLGVVAVDDVWGILMFGGVLAWVGASGAALHDALWELGGAIGLGALLGLPMALLTGRLRPGEPTRVEALGFVLLCSGAASLLHVPYLLAAVTMGAVVANVASHHDVPFRELENVEGPFLVLFFVLSGSSARLEGIAAYGLVALLYCGARILGRIVGGYAGAGTLVGAALLPQAGVALGMALVAAERIPSLGQELLPVMVLSTVAFELIGPVLTRWTLARQGELRATE